MIGPAMDRGGLKDSENAPNSIFPKINESPFWRFGTDMDISLANIWFKLIGFEIVWKYWHVYYTYTSFFICMKFTANLAKVS